MSDGCSQIYQNTCDFREVAISKYGHLTLEEALREDERLLQVIKNLDLELEALQDKIRSTKKYFNQVGFICDLKYKENKI